MRRRIRKKTFGFTIIEILIAIVILTVGILGILAIFPKAIESASKSIEDTYSGVIAQSVMDSIKTGVKETKVTTANTKYFLFQHEGVAPPSVGITSLDLKSTKPADLDNVAKYRGTILLPMGPTNQLKRYLYPQKLSSLKLTNGKMIDNIDYIRGLRESNGDPTHDAKYKVVADIYAFGNRPGVQGSSELLTFLATAGVSQEEKDRASKDPYLSYGFAIGVKSSALNNNNISGDLYFFDIYIFRNWISAMGHKAYKPIQVLSSLVAF